MVPMVTICDGREGGTKPPPAWDALYLERKALIGLRFSVGGPVSSPSAALAEGVHNCLQPDHGARWPHPGLAQVCGVWGNPCWAALAGSRAPAPLM